MTPTLFSLIMVPIAVGVLAGALVVRRGARLRSVLAVAVALLVVAFVVGWAVADRSCARFEDNSDSLCSLNGLFAGGELALVAAGLAGTAVVVGVARAVRGRR